MTDRYLLTVEREDFGVAYFGPFSTHDAALRAGARTEAAGCEWNVEYLHSVRGLADVIAA